MSKVFRLDELSCPQIWNIEQETDREKEKVGGRPAKFNEKEDDRAQSEGLKTKETFFCWKNKKRR